MLKNSKDSFFYFYTDIGNLNAISTQFQKSQILITTSKGFNNMADVNLHLKFLKLRGRYIYNFTSDNPHNLLHPQI